MLGNVHGAVALMFDVPSEASSSDGPKGVDIVLRPTFGEELSVVWIGEKDIDRNPQKTHVQRNSKSAGDANPRAVLVFVDSVSVKTAAVAIVRLAKKAAS